MPTSSTFISTSLAGSFSHVCPLYVGVSYRFDNRSSSFLTWCSSSGKLHLQVWLSWLPLTPDDTDVQEDLGAPCFHFFQFNWHHLSDATTFLTLNISKFALTFSQPESVLTSNVSYFVEWHDNLFIWTTQYYMGYSCKLCLFVISHSGQHNNDSLTLLILPWDFIFIVKTFWKSNISPKLYNCEPPLLEKTAFIVVLIMKITMQLPLYQKNKMIQTLI